MNQGKPPIYKVIETAKGKKYMKDNRFISAANLPPKVVEILQTKPTTTDEEAIVAADRNCLFCDEPNCKFTRLVNGQTIYLCEKDNYANNVGKIAQRIRERASEEVNQPVHP